MALSFVTLFGASGCHSQKPPDTSQVGPSTNPQPVCWRYQSLTAAIASATIECQGTIGPSSYTVDAKGRLVPSFTGCVPGATKGKSAAAAMTAPVAPAATAPAATTVAGPGKAGVPIGSAAAQVPPKVPPTPEELAKKTYAHLMTLLSLQDVAELTNIHDCLGGRWQTWKEVFARTNITTCPTWEKTEVIGAPTLVIDPATQQVRNLTAIQTGKMQPRLPRVDEQACPAGGSVEARRQCIINSVQMELQRDEKLAAEQKYAEYVLPPKTSAMYTVTMPPGVQCEDAAVCAAQCASAFPGFVLAASQNRVDGDATYWLSDEEYGTYFGYQHPMAQWNGPPGDTYGHINRIDEECWRWSPLPKPNGSFFVMRLIDSLLPGLSHCGPL